MCVEPRPSHPQKGEFKDIYGLNVAVVPPNRPDQRKDSSDVVFSREKGKWDAVVKEIKSYNRRGRPILVGTSCACREDSPHCRGPAAVRGGVLRGGVPGLGLGTGGGAFPFSS